MLFAFFFNGACTFGIRILASQNLAERYTPIYLVFWYCAGALLLGLISMGNRLSSQKSRGVMKTNVFIGVLLGAASALGQTSLGLALGAGLPGAIAYPIALAGGLFIVAGVGVFFFRERIGPCGIAGIVLGLVSMLLLSR
jgi:multidrug transporter EmrE-like cation transporter